MVFHPKQDFRELAKGDRGFLRDGTLQPLVGQRLQKQPIKVRSESRLGSYSEIELDKQETRKSFVIIGQKKIILSLKVNLAD